MSKTLKWVLRGVGGLALLIGLYLGGVIGYGTMTDYEPPESEALTINGTASLTTLDDTLSMVIWNIGYCGLGAEMDFFYDGGSQVRPDKERFEGYLNGMLNTAMECDTVDFLLFQEVDKNSSRSHNTDEVAALAEKLPGYAHSLAINYNVRFVPVPYTNPLGKTYGGLATFSKYAPSSSTRYSFPGNYDWPTSIFMLDRCFMVNRYPTANGKELLVINTHNSAYDDGTLKMQQMTFLKDFIMKEYEAGNYVIVGGDRNQCPPNFNPKSFGIGLEDAYEETFISTAYLPADWLWVYDPTVPTNRKLSKPYDPHKTYRTLIDFYLISPNVRALRVKGMNLDFQHSDHQPVYMKIALQ